MTQAIQTMTGHLVLSARGIKTQKIAVSDAAQAVTIWSQWRDSNGFGASDLKKDSGNLVDSKGKVIAKVSYNGKIWTADSNTLLYNPYSI